MTEKTAKLLAVVQEGTVPEGYTKMWHLMPEDWKDVPLSYIFKKKSQKNKGNNIKTVFTNSAVNGIIPQSEYFEKDIANSENTEGYFVVNPLDYVYNPRISENAPYGPFKRNDTGLTGIVSPLYTVLTPRKEFAKSEFLHYYLESTQWHKYAYSIANCGARFDRMNITDAELMRLPIAWPSLAEQERIVEILMQCDKIIELKRERIIELKRLKKECLRTMLPVNGCDKPEKRFPGFTDAWEQRKFGDVGSVSMCKRIFKNETSDVGDIPFYKIGTFGGEPDAYISRELFDEYREKFSYPDAGDVLLSASGTIGRIVEFKGEEAYFQDSNIVWLSHDKSISNKFLKVLYPTVKWDGIEGSTIKRLYNDNFLKTQFMMPKVEEQERIGEYFEQLDHLITLHQRELEESKVYKKELARLLLTGVVRVRA